MPRFLSEKVTVADESTSVTYHTLRKQHLCRSLRHCNQIWIKIVGEGVLKRQEMLVIVPVLDAILLLTLPSNLSSSQLTHKFMAYSHH